MMFTCISLKKQFFEDEMEEGHDNGSSISSSSKSLTWHVLNFTNLLSYCKFSFSINMNTNQTIIICLILHVFYIFFFSQSR
ncbi:hypothetical protein Lalb_Chr12g0206881 [Lupinus albus]|uniref:Uncharacterized protein n=1 Tax=Lupinus albus TaxID=3870 RepID=A0A6A4PND8_LUPAL|nr:hypothetical protein Lalb_Chr12g0206881 [Lupinus albus]